MSTTVNDSVVDAAVLPGQKIVPLHLAETADIQMSEAAVGVKKLAAAAAVNGTVVPYPHQYHTLAVGVTVDECEAVGV